MAAIALTTDSLVNAKRALKASFPEEKSSHLTEALAAACGFRTHAALLAAIKQEDPTDPNFVLLDDHAFVQRLYELSGEPIAPDEDYEWFDYLHYPSEQHVIKTKSKGLREIAYKSLRSKAWRNVMVAAINAGIESRLFTVRAGDNRWPGAKNSDPDWQDAKHVFRFSVGSLPAIASVSDAGYDELSVSVAFWPTAGAERWMGAVNAGFLAGEVFAHGWLERRDGAWLQVARKPYLWCRKNRLRVVAELVVPPKGFADRGSFKL